MHVPPDSFNDRLTAARAGSASALGVTLEAYRIYLLAIADRELDKGLRAKGGASDIVQDTFLEAQRDFSHFAGESEAELQAWLRRMLLHNVANFARSYHQTGKRNLSREVAIDGNGSSAGVNHPAENDPSPISRLTADEQTDQLKRAIGRLPPEYRQVLALRHEEDLSFEEIGAAMKRTANAARKLWVRAVELLKREMEVGRGG